MFVLSSNMNKVHSGKFGAQRICWREKKVVIIFTYIYIYVFWKFVTCEFCL